MPTRPAPGTDASATCYTVQREMGLFVEAGLTANQALHAATAETARYLRRGGEFGMLVPGMNARMKLPTSCADTAKNTATRQS